ncbi:MAG: 50S ribosomal protein L10 [Chloroflexota bacterium]|nr:50S ribosomal protein L10 [Chloroflexota bacterium]
MAISKEKKRELVADYQGKMERSRGVILTNYRGLDVAQINELRNRLREVGAGYHVIKNTLLRLALQKAGLPELDPLLKGPTAVGFCYQDVPPATRVLVDFTREAGNLGLEGGLLGSRRLSVEDINRLANLPSRGIMLAHVLAALQSPMRGLVNVLSGPMRGLVTVLRAGADELAPTES